MSNVYILLNDRLLTYPANTPLVTVHSVSDSIIEVVNSPSFTTTRTMESWWSYIVSSSTYINSVDLFVELTTFTFNTPAHHFKIANNEYMIALAEYTGLSTSTPAPQITAEYWGSFKCLLSGASNDKTTTLPASILIKHKDENPSTEYTTTSTRKYVANGGFNKNDILKVWWFESRWLDAAKVSHVLAFIHEAIANKADSDRISLHNFPEYITYSMNPGGIALYYKVHLTKSELPEGDRLERSLFKFKIALQAVKS